jgi:hypothetical protein
MHGKFTDCAELTLNASRMTRALDQIEGIEGMKDVTELVKTLS